MTNKRQSLGRWGEAAAAQFLASRGYAPLEKNVRTPYGEIDLVMQDGETLVFVEVKARTSRAYGAPETGITPQKAAHLIASAEHYLGEHEAHAQRDWRIDVVAVEQGAGGAARIAHFENAVTG
jgi:putative endonuclease